MSTKPLSRERRPSIGVPVADLLPVGPGFSRPKHKRTYTGLGPSDIKAVEATIPEPLREALVYIFIYVSSLPVGVFANYGVDGGNMYVNL